MTDKPDSDRYASKYPQVIFEEADFEVIVVNLLKGVYYYLTGSAAYIWMGLHSGQTPGQLADELSHLTSHPETTHADVSRFVRELVNLELIEGEQALSSDLPPVPVAGDFIKGNYVTPGIEVYSDLQDILLLDPVHEVDESGWPQAKTT